MTKKLIPTTLVGSYPQPAWLVDKDKMLGSAPPRVRMKDVWKVAADELDEAKQKAAPPEPAFDADRLAGQLERIAAALEKAASTLEDGTSAS